MRRERSKYAVRSSESPKSLEVKPCQPDWPAIFEKKAREVREIMEKDKRGGKEERECEMTLGTQYRNKHEGERWMGHRV